MIIFLYGQDTYRSRKKLGEITEHYQKVHKSGLNLKSFEGKELHYQDFKDEFQQTPMFQEKKLLVLKNIFQNQEFKNSFLENGKKFIESKNIIVFYEGQEISKNDPLFKFLAKNAKSQEFQLLKSRKLKNWIRHEFEKYGTEIRPEALEMLVNYTGNDLWQFSNEIQKLAAFRRNKTVRPEDIALLVRPQIETDIFKTIDAFASRNKKQALSLIHKHLEGGDNPLYLLSMINFQLRNLLIIKETGKLNYHPYLVRKTAWQSQKFTKEELKKIHHRLFEADLAIKTGRIDPVMALDLLITEI